MFRYSFGILSTCLIFIGLPVSTVYAGENIDYFSLAPDQLLNAEVISVSKKSQKLLDAASAVYVITSEDIRRSGVTTIPEALRMAPGVNVARADNNSWAISIRGFNNVLANKLLVMIDGRSVYNPLFAGTYWDLQDYVLEDIERIEVIRGPGGAVWGANAVNGVINIITKKSKDTQGNLVSVLYGNEEHGTMAARHGGSFGYDGFYRVYGKYFNRDSSAGIGARDAHDDWDGGSSGFRMDWGDYATLQGDVYHVNSDQRNSTPVLAPPYALIEDETMESYGANILGRVVKDVDGGGVLSAQAYLDYNRREQTLLLDERYILDAEGQYDFKPWRGHEVTAGGGMRYIHNQIEDAPIITFSPAERNDMLFSFFAQDKIELSPDRWYLTLGSKFEHNDYTGWEVQPSARLQFHPDERQMVWASVSRAVRTPSRLEHDLSYMVNVIPPSTSVDYQPNKSFKSEELTAYEAGYRTQLNQNVTFDIAAFYNDYDNLGTLGFLTASPGVFPFNYTNGMKAETYGFEVASTWKINSAVELSASYSYLDMFLHVRNNNGFNLESGEDISPHHQANIRTHWIINDQMTLNSNLYYTDMLKQYDIDNAVRFDLNFGYKINNSLRFNLVGQNLLDDSAREFSSTNALNAVEIERSVYGKFTWEF